MANNVSSTASTVPSNEVNLHLEFRTLSMLFTAVTTINRQQPSELPQAYDQLHYTRSERNSWQDLALNAIATILVRDPREVVAVVAYGASKYEPPKIYAMQDSECAYAAQGDSAVQSLLSKFTILANPDRKRPNRKFKDYLKLPNKPQPVYEKAKPGESHYGLISDSHWDCLDIQANTLENHLATVVHFLQQCSKVDSDGTAALLYTFHRYIVATCWRKMLSRIAHRYSGAMFSLLTTLEPQAMQIFFQKFASGVQPSSRKDSGLTWMLVDLEEKGLLQSFIELPLEGFVPSNSPDAKSLVDELRAASSSQSQQGLGAYNKHTCFVFHILLIATIRGFQINLQRLHDDKVNKDSKNRKRHAQQVLQFGRLLWRIAYSQILTYHLQLLEAANFLHTPVDASMRYIKDDTSLATSHSTDGDEVGDEVDDTAEDVEHGGPDHAMPGAAHKFRRWIRLLVSHWAALDILLQSKVMKGVDITLVHVRSIRDRVEMAPWDSTIHRLASLSTAAEPTDSFDAQRAIDSFIRNIENPRFDATSVKAFRKPETTQALHPKDVKFDGNIHCEVALALLVEQSAQGGDASPSLVSDINHSTIAVSKLCCPGCWETLNALRGDAKGKFKVRGCHGTVRTVDLPDSVPLNILNHMVELFRSRLRRELDIMVDSAKDSPSRSSMESDCFSTVSTMTSPIIQKDTEWTPPSVT